MVSSGPSTLSGSLPKAVIFPFALFSEAPGCSSAADFSNIGAITLLIDGTDLGAIEPVAAWDLSERACPWAGEPGVRFGAHQYREKLDGTLVYATWFAGGLRVLDLADPLNPVEVAHYMPDFPGGRAPRDARCSSRRPVIRSCTRSAVVNRSPTGPSPARRCRTA